MLSFRKWLPFVLSILLFCPLIGTKATLAAAPGKVMGVVASAVSSNKITLSWTAIADVSYYEIHRSTTSGFAPSTSTRIYRIATNAYQDFMLSPSTTYYYRITAVNSAGERGVYSNHAPATTTAAASNVHPSLYFYDSEASDIRARKSTAPWSGWYSSYKATADEALTLVLADVPHKARGTHALALAMAYFGETSNTAYLNKVKEYLTNMPTNKSTISSLYGSTLVVSYGAYGYAVAYDIIYPALTPAERASYELKLQQHAEILYDRIDTQTNNWIEVMGGSLAVTGAVLRDYSAGGRAWGQDYMARAKSNLERALLSHVKGGGSYDEGDSYMAYGYLYASEGMAALRSVGYTDLTGDTNHQNLLRYQTWNLMPLGQVPLFEDANENRINSARWIISNLYEQRVWSFQPRLKWVHDKLIEQGTTDTWFASYFRYYNAINDSIMPEGNSYIDPSSGLAYLRSGVNDEDLALSIASKPYTTGYMHQRPDEGSFQLWGLGAHLVHLPGYYSAGVEPYHSYARTAKALNLVSIDGGNPTATVSEGFLNYSTGNAIEYVEAYVNTPYGEAGMLRRTAIFVQPNGVIQGYYVLVDRVDTSSPTASVDWYLHGLSENLTVSGNNAEWVVPSRIGGENVHLHTHIASPAVTISPMSETFEEFMDSSGGQHAKFIEARPTTAGNARFLTVLYPRKASQAAPAFVDLTADKGVTVNANDVFFTQSTNVSKTVSSVTSDAIITAARKNGSTELDFYLSKHGKVLQYNTNKVGFSSNQYVDLVMEGLNGTVWVKTANTTITIKHPSITTSATVQLDGAAVSATATAGSITFTVSALNNHTITILP